MRTIKKQTVEVCEADSLLYHLVLYRPDLERVSFLTGRKNQSLYVTKSTGQYSGLLISFSPIKNEKFYNNGGVKCLVFGSASEAAEALEKIYPNKK